MRRELTNATIVGGMVGLRREAPFSRGPAVLAWPDTDGRFVARDYLLDGRVLVEPIDAESWAHLIDTDEMFSFRSAEPVSASTGARIWVLRPPFPDREQAVAELRRENLLRHEEDREFGATCVVVEEPHALATLDAWARKHFDDAYAYATRGQWDFAHSRALTAWTLDREALPDRTALLACILRRLGRPSESEDLLVAEGRCVGEDRLRDLMGRFGNEFGVEFGRCGTAPFR